MMYVAFRWLTVLSFAMWLGLCCLDHYLIHYKTHIFLPGTAVTAYKIFKYNNDTILEAKKENVPQYWHGKKNFKQPRVLHYVTFLTGAMALILYAKQPTFVTFCRCKLGLATKILETRTGLKITIAPLSVAVLQIWNILWGKMRTYVSKETLSESGQNTNLSLLKRLQDLVRDRKALGRILMAAIDENKNIRRQYQLETIAKNRLLRYVQDTQSVMKQNNSRYVDFQQLYLNTANENSVLKNTIKNLRNEKAEAENNLLDLINVVYKSKNNDLKAYCTRFLVLTRKSFLNSDVSAEIREFLQKSKPCVSNNQVLKSPNLRNKHRITEICEDFGNLPSFSSSGPRLRGLPGEFVWTVKDKNGIIEKLYEYDYETDYDNGDTIRRIREYSVYHDKDCLLDYTNLAANIPTCPSLSASAARLRLDFKPFSSQRFLSKILVKPLTHGPLRLPSDTRNLRSDL